MLLLGPLSNMEVFVSGSDGAVVLQNAKRKRHLDTGKFGLDW